MEEEKIDEGEVADFLDDLDIEEELREEEKVRKKNAKILLISIIGLVTIAVVFFGVNYYNRVLEESPIENTAIPPLLADSKSETLPFQNEMEKVEEVVIDKAKSGIKETKSNVPPPHPDAKVTENKISKPSVPANKKEVKIKKPPSKTSALKQVQANKKGQYQIQLGVFVVEENAKKLFQSLSNKGFTPSLSTVKQVVQMYQIYSGAFILKEKAEEEIRNLQKAGIKATFKAMSDNLYTLHIGSFYLKKNVENLKKKIIELGLSPKITRSQATVDARKVYVGNFKTKKAAELIKEKLAKKGFSESIIVKGS